MNKLLTAFCLAIVTSVGAFAQAADEYNKNEFFVGYSNQLVDRGSRDSFSGVEGSYVRNVSRYVGIKGDISGTFRNDDFETSFTTPAGPTRFRTENKNSLYNFLGGVQIKDNASEARVKPFGHALAGVAHTRTKFETSGSVIGSFDDTFSDTGFAAALGGGIDVRVNERFDIRAIQVDYNPIRIGEQWSQNIRFGIGIVFK